MTERFRARSGIARISVIKPHTDGIKSGAIEGDVWRQVKGCEIGGDTKSSTITTPYHTTGVERRMVAGIGYAFMRPRNKFGDSDRWRELVSGMPGGSLPASEDMAHAIVFLASARARFISGVVLTIDGGMCARQAVIGG